MPAPIVGAVATQVAIPFLKKHPWVLFAAIGIPALAIFLVVCVVFGLMQGFGMLKVPWGQSCPDGTVISSAEVLPEDMGAVKDASTLVTSCETTPIVGSGEFVLPTTGTIFEFYGMRFVNYMRFHYAMDISAGAGAPIFAASDGTVIFSGPFGTYGNFVEIDHGNGITSGYAHMRADQIYVKKGDQVIKGQQIALQGNEGESYGAHLHFEIRSNGERIDPLLFYLHMGINMTDTYPVAGSVYQPTKYGYCDTPDGKYFSWCPGYNPNNTAPAPPPPVGGGTPGDGSPKDYARQQVAARGWAASEFTCLDQLWEKESNWNYKALNPSSGAYGIPQALPGNKMATKGPDWQTNPNTQIDWGLDYIAGRYKVPCAAWQHSIDTDWY